MNILCDKIMNDNNFQTNDGMNIQIRNALMLEIMRYQLAALDNALFLDTHPNDPIGLIRHNEYTTKLAQLKDEFTKQFGPLDIYTADMASNWRYIDSPWPWEQHFN